MDGSLEANTPLKALNVPHTVRVRWNSVYLIMHRGLRLKTYINDFISSEIETQNYPSNGVISHEEWIQLRTYATILEPLYQPIKRSEGIARKGSYGALWDV